MWGVGMCTEASGTPGEGVQTALGAAAMAAGIQTQVLCKRNTHSSPRGHLVSLPELFLAKGKKTDGLQLSQVSWDTL